MFLVRLPIVMFLLIYQSAFLALSQIWNNKVRSTLTTIGIVIGVASVTAVIAALTGLQANVLSEFESIGTNKIFVFPYWEAHEEHQSSAPSAAAAAAAVASVGCAMYRRMSSSVGRSDTTFPSFIRTIRRACRATSGSWVTMMIV